LGQGTMHALHIYLGMYFYTLTKVAVEKLNLAVEKLDLAQE